MKKKGFARHVRLFYWMMDSPAWKDLDARARAVYVELARRYAGPGSTNGRIVYSVRQAADDLRISKSAAANALRSLQEHGFIFAMQRGAFTRKNRHATEWRLTEFDCDVTKELNSKDFMRWQPTAPKPEPPKVSIPLLRVVSA